MDTIRPDMAKAGLDRTSQSDAVRSEDTIGSVAQEIVLKHYGTVKRAAISLNVDPSQMQRDLAAGKLAVLDRDPECRADVAAALDQRFGRLTDPKTRAKRTVRELRRLLEEVDQFVDCA